MEAVIDQVKALAANLDATGRAALINALYEQQCQLESPLDALRRFGNGHLTLAAAHTACDLGVLKKIAEEGGGCGLNDLANHAGASTDLLGPIMRFLASVRVVKELGLDLYAANDLTRALSRPEFEATLRHFFDVIGPVVQALPNHLKAQKYRTVAEMDKTAMQVAFNTELSVFDFLKTKPQHFLDMQKVMTIQRTTTQWFNAFPVEHELQSWNQEKTAIVDSGGGKGHQCVELKAKYPQLSGRMVLQDLPETLKPLEGIEGVELMPHDFFDPQPVKGAKFYYLRQVLHDWSDERCVAILKNIVSAMDESSRILIDEVVVPNKDANWQVAQMDLLMMAFFGAKERTNQQWHALCEAAGLRVLDVVTYAATNQNSVIVAVPK